MKYLWYGILPLVMSVVTPARAEAEKFKDYPDLPPLQMVMKSMAINPVVLGAQAGIKAEQANQSRLNAGSYEYSVKLGSQQRAVYTNPVQRFNEWDVALERPFRLPGKAALDTELGSQGVAQARLAHGDALHESGRILLKTWFVWVREHYQSMQWLEQVEVLKNQLSIVNKRIKAGDAPRLEGLLAEAAVAQAESTQQQVALREQIALTDLTYRFPGIVAPDKIQLTIPEPLPHAFSYWYDQILQHNHELGLARGDSKRWQLMASRTRADQIPDPAVGIRYANERGGEEHLVGLSVSIPLPGRARQAVSENMLAQSEMAAQREAGTLARLNAETANSYASARAAFESWKKSRDAADRIKSTASLMTRAYALGEASLPDVLAARRQAIETELNATMAQIDAAENRYRLLLDAHQLWPLDVDEDEDDAHAHY